MGGRGTFAAGKQVAYTYGDYEEKSVNKNLL